MQCGCLRSAFDFITRARRAFPAANAFDSYHDTLLSKLRLHFNSTENFDTVSVEEYPDKGAVRRELYPWNQHEPDRFASDVLTSLNEDMKQIAPKLEVKVAELPLLR